MKANGVPEKIYLTTDGNNSFVFTQKRSDNEGIEYTRTDTFIEKARKYIANHFLAPGMDNEINDFVNYMKGE